MVKTEESEVGGRSPRRIMRFPWGTWPRGGFYWRFQFVDRGRKYETFNW